MWKLPKCARSTRYKCLYDNSSKSKKSFAMDLGGNLVMHLLQRRNTNVLDVADTWRFRTL